MERVKLLAGFSDYSWHASAAQGRGRGGALGLVEYTAPGLLVKPVQPVPSCSWKSSLQLYSSTAAGSVSQASGMARPLRGSLVHVVRCACRVPVEWEACKS
jgi:hypothetical protein